MRGLLGGWRTKCREVNYSGGKGDIHHFEEPDRIADRMDTADFIRVDGCDWDRINAIAFSAREN